MHEGQEVALSFPPAFVEELRGRAQRRIERYHLSAEEAARRRGHAEPAQFTADGRLRCPDCVARGDRAWLAPWHFDRTMLWCDNCGFLVPYPAQ
jgi:hypothetical protein